MPEPIKTVRIHRFNELVAFDTDISSETLYITAELARWFAKTLNEYADDIDSKRFTASNIGTRTLGE